MTDEEKISQEAKVCKCGELGRFFTQVAAIFLGVLLAILVSASILKPKMPCHKGGCPLGRPGIERQLPPGPMHKWHGPQEQKGEFNPDVQQMPPKVEK